MNVTEHAAAEPEAEKAAYSGIISDLRNATQLDRLNMTEIRYVLHRMAVQGYTIVKAASVAEAKAKLAALPVTL